MEIIHIPDGVKEIGEKCFIGCESLESIQLPENISELPTYFEEECVGSIPLFDYHDNGWKSSSPPSREYCERQAMYRETISQYEYTPFGMFSGCSHLKSIEIPEKVTKIDVCAFADCSALEEVILHEGIQLIRDYAFVNCISLKKSWFPETVKAIERSAFEGCSGLKSVTIPENVSIIEENVFKGCSPELIIYGRAGSYAETYAQKNNIRFKTMD